MDKICQVFICLFVFADDNFYLTFISYPGFPGGIFHSFKMLCCECHYIQKEFFLTAGKFICLGFEFKWQDYLSPLRGRICHRLGMNTYTCIQGYNSGLSIAVPPGPVKELVPEHIFSKCLHFDVSISATGPLLGYSTFASGLARVSSWTVSILLPSPYPRTIPVL